MDSYTIGFYFGVLAYFAVLGAVYWFVGRWGWIGIASRAWAGSSTNPCSGGGLRHGLRTNPWDPSSGGTRPGPGTRVPPRW